MRARHHWIATLLLATAVGALAPPLVGDAAPARLAAADPLPHASLVPETPARGYPIIHNTPYVSTRVPRQVKAIDQVGRMIVSGGDFYEVELQNGTVLQQKYFAAWDMDTKQLLCPQQFTFDDEVLAIEPGPTPTTVYVGGRFTKVTGADGVLRTRNKIALLDLATCSVDNTFVSIGANDKVNEIELFGTRLFVAGDFTAISGQPIETIAELNASTGAANAAFNFTTVNELTSRVVGMEVAANGTRLYIGGRFGIISRNGRSIPAPTAIIDITNPTNPVLTLHQSTGYVPISRLADVGIDPAGSLFGLAFAPGSCCDYVYGTRTTEAPVLYSWVHNMNADSAFSVAVTNNAVYAAGHFCHPASGPGVTTVMSPKMGLDVCSGSGYSGVWRSHLIAFSRTDGTPLAWNPGQDSLVGGRAITPTTRGLLIGHDGQRTNSLRTGAVAFLDFGPTVEDSAAPSDVVFSSPVANSTVNTPVTIAGLATDDVRVLSYRIAVRNNAKLWLQPDGSFGAYTYQTVNARSDGSFALDLTLPADIYTVYATAVDIAGRTSATTTQVKFTMSGLDGQLPTSAVDVSPTRTTTEAALSITGTATDNESVASLAVQVYDTTGRYVQDDGTLATTVNDLPVTITGGALGSPSVSWSVDVGRRLPGGTYTVQARAQDAVGNNATGTGSFRLTATAPVVTLGIAGGTTPFTPSLNLVVNATDDGTVASLSAELRNAAGLDLQPDGTFATTVSPLPLTLAGIGTPNASGTTVIQLLPVGTYTVHAVSVDGAGKSVTIDLPLVITATAPAPPVVVSPGDQNTLVNASVSVKVPAADPDGGTVTFSATGLPAGLSIDPVTGTISGTATAPGTFPVTITATDDEATFTDVAINWTVTAACVATVQPAGGVLVDWAPIAGVTTYTVRVNGGWLADVSGGATDYLHATGTAANAYQVRYRLAGVTTNVDCPF